MKKAPYSSIYHFGRCASVLMVVSALCSTAIAQVSLADEMIFGIIPEAEWSDGRISVGGITPNALNAVEVAAGELRKHGRKIENFRSIHVSETEVSYIVQFSDTELHSTINDDRTPPAGGHLAIFRIDKRTFVILGAVY